MYLVKLNKIGIKDINLVGGKSSSLGEMIQNLPHVKIPPGFALTTKYYEKFIKHNNLKKTIKNLLKRIDYNDLNSLNYYGNLIRKNIINAEMPLKYISNILDYYKELGNNVSVAVRSSSTAEDLEMASFAGQQDTYLNVVGIDNILFAVKKCFASLYTDRAISYRNELNYNLPLPLTISVCIQQMVRSDKGCSGVAFSLDPESGFKDVIVINGSYGLGESIVQGHVLPDEFIVYKNTLSKGYNAIIDKKLGVKNQKTIYRDTNSNDSNNGIEQIAIIDNKTFCLEDPIIIQLSNWIMDIEKYYNKPMDIEWAYDNEKLYIVQARPETIHSNKQVKNHITEHVMEKHNIKPILTGVAVGNKITSGEIKIIESITDTDIVFNEGDVLVTDITDPDWEPLMKKASAIITNKGGRTCFDGETMVLTNKGIIKMCDLFNKKEDILVPSINRTTLKIEWKMIEHVMKKNSQTIRVYINNDKSNYLDLTEDHKMINIIDNEINDISITEIIKTNNTLTCLKYLPKCINYNLSKNEIYNKLEILISKYVKDIKYDNVSLEIDNFEIIQELIYLCLRLRIKYNIIEKLNNYTCILSNIGFNDYYSMNVDSDFNISDNWVYNLTVEDNHNYVVLTNNYCPILVNNCHASIIARELGINALVGTKNGSTILTNYINNNNDKNITVSCAEGEIGFVYPGLIPYTQNDTDINNLPLVKTKIMLNIASPVNVFKYAMYPQISGVGLVREEFIINNYIQIHPLALINYNKLDKATQNEINNIVNLNVNSYTEYYINKLSYGIARIAATFYPNDVIVRFSDFKSNEYRNLLGGIFFEPNEENPMIGWRGASRYYSEDFIEAFKLECKAIYQVRNIMGLTNVIVMIPFCRTVKECKNIIEIMKSEGLNREDGLKVYIMCEIPSNVILASKFCKYVDGFSIGSNDLTQLTLGLDRDSELVSHIYKETDKSVKYMIKKAIKTCKKHDVKIGICGQGPSDNPKFAQFLVKQGIDSISVVPDSLIKTILAISEVEKNM
ncbi:pyruvate phosphate dikinase with Hedgehog [Hokovirus HKV1]|uniref:pyruvate, water dikinase n=1 Tax=Hokovirus HKV1 TaxID=1977638 RepID=A0A1V0SGR7_9VIRU|nr:pyruvate phosphate dikinase with Hedgehog [Hokovirus HKV1]